jgi:RimJ/RimL family protein N-acetyltransferase
MRIMCVSTWGDPDANLRLLNEPPANGNWRAIIEADGRKSGFVLWQHPTREELDVAGLADIPTSVIDIDIMIGEFDALGRGLGSGAIASSPRSRCPTRTVPFVMACARLDNLASQRAFAKAGFRKDREFDDVPNGLLCAHGASPSGRADRMNQPGPRFWEIFFEVYENLPRQGPGNRTCAARALGLCRELPESPAILDLGCGVGGQTLQLAELTSGSIVAIDSHAPSIERLKAAIAERGLSQRVDAVVGDMAHPGQPLGVSTSSGRKARSTTSAFGTPFASAMACCDPAATLRSPMRSGARRTRLPRSRPGSIWITRPWDGWMMMLQRYGTADSSSSDTSPCLMKRGGTISIRPWKRASPSCEANTPPMLKPRPYSTSSPRSPKCTAAIPTSMPMSSS